MKITYRRHFLATLSVSAGLLLGVAGLNLSLDPAHFRSSASYLFSPWDKGEALEPPDNFVASDLRAIRMRQIENRKDPFPLAILGTCNALGFASDALRSPKPFNLAVYDAEIEDLIVLWETMARRSVTPKYAVVFVNPDMLSNWYGTEMKWWPHRATLARFFARAIPRPDRMEWLSRWALGFEGVSSELLSLGLFRESLRKGLLRARGEDEPRIVAVSDGAGQGAQLMTEDGVVPQDRSHDEEPSATFIEEMSHWRLDGATVQGLRAWLNDARARGTKMIWVVPPISPRAFSVISGLPSYPAASTAIRELLSRLKAEGLLSGACDMLEEGSRLCRPEDFLKFNIFSPSCARRTLGACLSREGISEVVSRGEADAR